MSAGNAGMNVSRKCWEERQRGILERMSAGNVERNVSWECWDECQLEMLG